MPTPLYTQEQIDAYGPPLDGPEVYETETHVYICPFQYKNVEVGDVMEIDPTKGIEFKADTGWLTIKEEKPIVSVAVVGSGCAPGGYNIVEWWGEGETIDNMTNQLVKRQRIDNLNGVHPMIMIQILMQTFPGLTITDILPPDTEIADNADSVRRLTEDFCGTLHTSLYENTAVFHVGPPYPNKITVRSGCRANEVSGFECLNEYPAHYAVRVVKVEVIK